MELSVVLKGISSVDGKFYKYAQKRLDSLTKPQGSLGRLEEFARRLVAITEEAMPTLDKKVIFTFAGDHGVTEEGVSAYPKEVTRQMVFNFLNGGAGINVLARHAGAEVVVIDIGVDYNFNIKDGPRPAPTDAIKTVGAGLALPNDDSASPLTKESHSPASPLTKESHPPASPLTKGGIKGGYFISKKVIMGTRNMRRGPAMTREEAEQCIEVGIGLATEYAKKGYKIYGTGDMGIGNTTPSSAIASVLTGRSVKEVTGRGTGISDEVLINKIKVIEDAISVNKPDPSDPIDVLSKVGGAEIGGIAGVVLGAAANRIPVIIDGFISTAGALIAYYLEPKTRDYMFAAHNSQEIGHRVMLEKIGLKPILDLDLRLGEGTGAALAMLMIEAGLKIYKEMATFEEAGVSNEIQN